MDDKLKDEEARLAALRRYDILDSGEEEQFQRIVELTATILGAPMAAITLVDAERQWFKASTGITATSVPRDITFCTHTIQQTEPLSIPDATADGRFSSNPMVTGDAHIRSYLGVPLRTPEGYNVGTLCAIDREPRAFDARQGEILTKLAEIVVEQFELRQIAKQDSMTGALSRSGFLAEAEREFLRASRYERPSVLLVIDVDGFKAINDRYGHPAGDAVLVSIANSSMAAMRRSDIFGRIGGDKFGMLLPETEPEEALAAAGRIRNTVESTIVEAPNAAVRATVSIGIAPIPALSEGVATWFSEADIALYEAKQYGRNRVVAGKPRRPVLLPTDPAHQSLRPH